MYCTSCLKSSLIFEFRSKEEYFNDLKFVLRNSPESLIFPMHIEDQVAPSFQNQECQTGSSLLEEHSSLKSTCWIYKHYNGKITPDRFTSIQSTFNNLRTTTDPLPSGISGGALIHVDNRILHIGGFADGWVPIKDVFEMNLETLEWTTNTKLELKNAMSPKFAVVYND